MEKYDVLDLHPYRSGGIADLQIGRLKSGERVICRRLQEQYRFNWRIRRCFANGIKIRQRLPHHPHIVGSYETGGTMLPYEVIEYVDGLTLTEWMNKYHERMAMVGTEIILQTAKAVQHVHRHGYLHLDIKPGNLLVANPGDAVCVRLTDFDLAVPSRNTKADKNQRMGTFNYMPPEQLQDGHLSEGTDIFAFGVLAYHFFTGKMPYPADNVEASRRKKLEPQFTVPPLQEVNRRVHWRMSELVMKCLERDLDTRLPAIYHAVRTLQDLRERNY